MIKFSIIVPCFNLENIIDKTIKNVLSQTFNNFELIIIDDGSTDNSLTQIKQFQLLDSRIKVWSIKNSGVSVARNLGIIKSSGEYILFLDGDDLIDSSLLERANEVFSNSEIDMFTYGYAKVNSSLNKIYKSYISEKYNNTLFTGFEFQKKLLKKNIFQCMCSFIIKKEIVISNNIQFDIHTRYGEDQEFQFKCNLKCKYIYYDAKDYFLYVQRDGSAVNKKFIRKDFDVLYRILENSPKKLEPYFINYIIYTLIYYFKEIKLKGTDINTLEKLFKMDYIFKRFKMSFSKYDIVASIFIIFYYLFYKKYLKNKYSHN